VFVGRDLELKSERIKATYPLRTSEILHRAVRVGAHDLYPVRVTQYNLSYSSAPAALHVCARALRSFGRSPSTVAAAQMFGTIPIGERRPASPQRTSKGSSSGDQKILRLPLALTAPRRGLPAQSLPLHCLTNQTSTQQGKCKYGFASMYRAGFLADVLPGLTLIVTAYTAALVTFRVVRQTSRGRARSALAWIAGFGMGLLTQLLFSIAGQAASNFDGSVFGEGLLGAFIGPFIGMVHGKWAAPVRKKRYFPRAPQSPPQPPR
jgi:hypothetical protein